MNSVKDFYGKGKGDRLIDPLFYPKSIRLFLIDEEMLLNRLSQSFDLLVEVGCMHGRYLEWAVDNGKHYLGVDVVRRYVSAGKSRLEKFRRSSMKHKFVLGGAENISKIVVPSDWNVTAERCLLLFPFNSFGNMPDPFSVATSLGQGCLPFLISSYRTSVKATTCRERYYRNCGYRSLRRYKSGKGIRFTSPDGLNTMAYEKTFILELFRSVGMDVCLMSFSQIGMAYMKPETVALVKG